MGWPGGCGIDREILFGRDHHLVAAAAEPDRDGGCKDALAGYAPVPFHLRDPVLHPQEHVIRIPGDLAGCLHDRVLVDPHEPLALAHDLDRGLAPPAGADPLLEDFLAGEDLCPFHVIKDGLPALGGLHARIAACDPGHPPLPVDSLPQIEVVLLPPVHVLLVAKGADHHGPRPERGVNGGISNQGDPMSKERHSECPSCHAAISFVFRVDCHRHACREQFGPRGGDLESIEIEVIEGGLARLVRHFRKGNGGLAPRAEVDGVLALVDVPAGEHP